MCMSMREKVLKGARGMHASFKHSPLDNTGPHARSMKAISSILINMLCLLTNVGFIISLVV
jgi:hypothetical protein